MELRHLTEEQKGAVIAVTQHYINMLYNNIIEDCGIESFEGWCTDGDIFDEDGREDCIELMHKVAPLIDKLTYEYLNLGH